MPIYEFKCRACGEIFEELVLGKQVKPPCPACGADASDKILSAVSSAGGVASVRTPGPNDHGCCGSNPKEKGCIPGSCCGQAKPR